MNKIEKKLNAILTVVMVFCMLLCAVVCIQVIQGKEASVFGFRIYHIMTGSMEPTIPTGSKILVRSVDPYTLEVGDVITFESRDEAIYGYANTHRIIEIEEDENGELCFVTRGDANSSADRMRVYPADIKGKVVFGMNGSFNMFLSFLQTKLGFVTVIVLPLMLVIWLLMRDFRKEVNAFAARNAEASLETIDQPGEEAAEPVPTETETSAQEEK